MNSKISTDVFIITAIDKTETMLIFSSIKIAFGITEMVYKLRIPYIKIFLYPLFIAFLVAIPGLIFRRNTFFAAKT